MVAGAKLIGVGAADGIGGALPARVEARIGWRRGRKGFASGRNQLGHREGAGQADSRRREAFRTDEITLFSVTN